MPDTQHERIAIIGGGCTGTTCLWALQNTAHDVHLFEASSTLGGRIKEYWLEDSGNKRVINTETPTFNAETSRQCPYNRILCYLKTDGTSSQPRLAAATSWDLHVCNSFQLEHIRWDYHV